MILQLAHISIVIYGLASQSERWDTVDEWTAQGYHDVTQVRTTAIDPIRANHFRLTAIKALKSISQFPALVLENDAEKTEWYEDSIELPDGCDVLYLGLYSAGLDYWHGKACTGAMEYDRINSKFIRPHNLLATHAMVLTAAGRDKLLELLTTDIPNNPKDEIVHDRKFAEYQPRPNWLAVKHPYFFQNDENQELTNFKLS